MEQVAILIDGSFFLLRARRLLKNFDDLPPSKVAKLIRTLADAHVEKGIKGEAKLYRIFYYDCPPLGKKVHLPISGRVKDFKRDPKSEFRLQLFEELKKTRKLALRLGYLSKHNNWQIKNNALKELKNGSRSWEQLTDEDWFYSYSQKGVDSKVAVDISSLALKKQITTIVLIAGDADFVPAAKLARREGVDLILDPLFNHIDHQLFEHIDGCHSTEVFKAANNRRRH